MTEHYLGDGLYCRFDGFSFWLRAPRLDGDHVVALDPYVLKAFLDFVFSQEPVQGIIKQLKKS